MNRIPSWVCPGAILLWALSLPTHAQDLSWSVPPDGGTPRDTHRIEQAGPREFRIRAAFEEGGVSILRHAVSRVDLLCRNAGRQPLPITLHLDLSGDGQRTDYDNKPEAGMKQRDFIFIQSPGQDWRQVNGTTERWVATVKFAAAPGETKVGLSPWYTYGDYLSFTRSLRQHPHLEKRLVGRSDGGREHWELTVTDPAIPAEQKHTIFWQAREHAYESWSSFAMEGLLEFLLSEEAVPWRQRFLIVIHPMTNVDGVARGFEYRGGYDFPDARAIASGRLTFEAIDRLRPDCAVAWHNWVAPRDRNVVFYTDGEKGLPLPRAWHRFTQLFPSLHAAEHRWKDETTPLKYNWEGRPGLSDANVHQYAMKKYGTRIWGWEMPWWNYSTAEVRRSGADFARAFLTTIEEIRIGSVPGAEKEPDVAVPRWEMHEFVVQGRAHVGNPFRDAALVGEFISPSRQTNVVDGFYDGEDTWRLRYAPDEEGEWKYLLRGEGVSILRQGVLHCGKPVGRGFIRVHPNHPYAFAQDGGTPFFPMGDTCYGLFDDSPITPELRTEYLRARRSQKFNFVRMTIGHSEARAAADPAFWAWGGTPQAPDLDRFNPDFFHRFDGLMQQMRSAGMNVELILLNYYRRPFTDIQEWTRARERQWLRYVLARYAAFDHIFLWTLANEYETHPDGKYRLDDPGDLQWVTDTARFIKANDPVHHLVTVHPVISASGRGDSPRSPFDPPWRIGEFFGRDAGIDVLSQQTGQVGGGVVWDESLQCWKGDPGSVTDSALADRRFHKPVLNTESGYEYLRDEPTSKRQVHHTDKVRRAAWRIVCAGAYFAAGFQGTIGHSDAWNRLDPEHHYKFVVRDEGAAAQLGALYDFWTALPFWRMQPFEDIGSGAVALAEPGAAYGIYLPQGGSTQLDLTDAPGLYDVRWFDPRHGVFGPAIRISGGAKQPFTAPDANDWAVQITRRSVSGPAGKPE